jgi:uncharacterized protein YjiS (DUF1127 family)
METQGTHERKDRDMDMTHISPRRQRPAPRSALPRTNAFFRFIADQHDLWLINRAHARWRRELRALDTRILRDIGLTYATIDNVSRAAHARDMAQLQARAEITIPPQCHPSLTNMTPHVEV